MRLPSILFGVAFVGMLVFGAVMGVRAGRPWIDEKIEYFTYGYVLPSNVERRVATIDGERVSFLVVHIPDSMTWRLENDPASPKTVHEWRQELSASLVMNGSYFLDTNKPAGYYAIDGVQSGDAECPTFDSLSCEEEDQSGMCNPIGYTFGVYIEDGDLKITYLPDIPETFSFCSNAVTGFASFPTVVLNDQSMIEKDSELKARRTMLARLQGGAQQIILTESGEPTLYDVAQWLVGQPETYEIVGNLDGGPSTGISISNGLKSPVEVPSALVPNVIVGEFRKIQ